MAGRLAAKVCVVTGTGGSMGRATALTFARDRVGEKPLVYFWNGRTLAFASELKALAPLHASRVDPEALGVEPARTMDSWIGLVDDVEAAGFKALKTNLLVPGLTTGLPPTLYGAPTPPPGGDAEPTQVLPPVPQEPPSS